ncbi:hypothetical protein HU200_000862 [Digitaria exilis]|uniref:Enoyl reductase (ER) domain-containing protein n=1 Tax=Digitaria exilis TaxID=1010633 RepID=A0A835G0K2_9POAL|nr:hypothetical protein HU200_000862 [Digitaria exilis]
MMAVQVTATPPDSLPAGEQGRHMRRRIHGKKPSISHKSRSGRFRRRTGRLRASSGVSRLVGHGGECATVRKGGRERKRRSCVRTGEIGSTKAMAAPKKTMRALQYEKYGGGAEGLKHVEVPVPSPKKGEVLLKLEAASINPIDWKIQKGMLGTGVTNLKPGDKVISISFPTGGGLGEYAVAPASLTVSRPPEVSAAEGASLPTAASTALQQLNAAGVSTFDDGGSGDDKNVPKNILITAASGGVGHYAVQLAKLAGLHVTATCGARNLGFVSSLGADEVLDYKTPEGAKLRSPSGRKYDAVAHCATGTPWSTFAPVLAEHATVVDVTPGIAAAARSFLQKVTFAKQRLVPLVLMPKKEEMEWLVEITRQGKLKTVIDSRYPLSRAQEAWAKSMEGHATGKIVVEMGGEDARVERSKVTAIRASLESGLAVASAAGSPFPHASFFLDLSLLAAASFVGLWLVIGILQSVSRTFAMSTAVKPCPSWVLLEPFVPSRTTAMQGATSWHAPFRVVFSFDEPPHISRLYAPQGADALGHPGNPPPSRPASRRYQDFYIYNADKPSTLESLPPCTEPLPHMNYALGDRRMPRRCTTPAKEEGAPAKPRLLAVGSMATTPNRSIASSWLYRGVSAIDAGRVLKFVDVARDDGIGYGVLKPGAAFTITCHTLPLGSMVLKDRLGRTVWNKRTALFFGYALNMMWLVAINMNTGTQPEGALPSETAGTVTCTNGLMPPIKDAKMSSGLDHSSSEPFTNQLHYFAQAQRGAARSTTT